MRSFVLRLIVIENCYVGGFPLEDESEHCFLSIKVLFWCCGFIYCVVPLLFFAIFIFSTIIIDLVANNESTKLKEHERNYATHDLELASIIHELKMWRHYLTRRIFELQIDHCGLKHLFGQPTLNFRQTRWIEFLSEYDFEIKNITRKENQVDDVLSRRAHEVHIVAISMYMTDMKDKIIEATNLDQHYIQIKETLQQGNLQQKFKYYELQEDRILMYRGKVYVLNPREMKNIVLR
jgi:hypothetical protein